MNCRRCGKRRAGSHPDGSPSPLARLLEALPVEEVQTLLHTEFGWDAKWPAPCHECVTEVLRERKVPA